MVDSTGTTSWTYNNGSEVTQLSTPQGTISYTYQTSGRRATMVETGVGTTTYGYDSAGRMTSLQNPFSETTTFAYDDGGRMTKKTFHSGAYTDYAYDARDRVTSIHHKKSDNSTISSESYVYDNASNMSSKTVDGVTTSYTYDNIDQLLSESRTGYSASYTYDANGNRASKTLNGVTDTYTVDSSDKLTSISLGGGGTKTYGYDTAGRTTSVTTSGGTTTLSYDYEGRITQITYPNLSTNTLTYNGLSARTSKTDSAGTATFNRDGVMVTSPILSDGSANYTPGISERRTTGTRYVHGDHLASMKSLTDSSQVATDTRQYDAFGLQLSSSGSTSTMFGFAAGHGYQTDGESGLMLLGYRYYDCGTGRFLTRDPAKAGANWYTYTESAPTRYVDPEGLEIKVNPKLPQYRIDLINTAINFIEQTPVGKAMVGKMRESKTVFYIDAYDGKPLGSTGKNVNINFKELDKIHIQTTEGWKKADLISALAHEFGHAYYGHKDDGPRRMKNIDAVENPIRKSLKLPARTAYEIRLIP